MGGQFWDKFKLIYYFVIQHFYKEFCACMHTTLLIFHFLVSLLSIHEYLYWYEQYEKSCFLFKVKEHTYIIHFLVSLTKVGIKLFIYLDLFIKVLFGVFVNVHVPL